MNRNRIEDGWKKVNGNVTEQWNDLTEDQLDSRIRAMFDKPDDDVEPESELTDWQQRLSEIKRVARQRGRP